ncbi:Glutathione transport system permease protein GsiD [compost metagenome]
MLESSLSFLGFGVQPPNATWGSMLNSAQGYIAQAPYLALFPGLMILLTVLSFNVLGDILRVGFEPKLIRR